MMESKHVDEQALVAQLRAGQESAVAELAREYGPRIQQVALRYVKNPEDAEEITQDVLLKAVEKIAAFRGEAALSSWLFRITFNKAMSRLRRTRASRAAEAAPDAVTPAERLERLELPDWSEMADEAVLRAQMRQRLAHALRALPAIYRRPLILRDVRGLTTEEASEVLRVTDQTLKSRLHRGRLMLRRHLADFAGGLAMHRPVAQGA